MIPRGGRRTHVCLHSPIANRGPRRTAGPDLHPRPDAVHARGHPRRRPAKQPDGGGAFRRARPGPRQAGAGWHAVLDLARLQLSWRVHGGVLHGAELSGRRGRGRAGGADNGLGRARAVKVLKRPWRTHSKFIFYPVSDPSAVAAEQAFRRFFGPGRRRYCSTTSTWSFRFQCIFWTLWECGNTLL